LFVEQFRKPLELLEMYIPSLGAGEILVKTEACGVCHTDLRAAHGDWPVKPAPHSRSLLATSHRSDPSSWLRCKKLTPPAHCSYALHPDTELVCPACAGGLGGEARANKFTCEQRREIARLGGLATRGDGTRENGARASPAVSCDCPRW
jgi:hypothetical protein